jgi:hypothetical protein
MNAALPRPVRCHTVRRRSLPGWTVLLVVATAAPAGAVDLDVETLRREVRQLEQSVQVIDRRLDRLESAARSSAARGDDNTARRTREPSAASPPVWLDAQKWRSLKPGMSAQDVIARLGPPTAVRPGASEDERVLVYTLELDVNAFLSGSVRVRTDRVVSIEAPVLK